MVSATAGRSPSSGVRLGRLWPIARNRPALTSDQTAGAGVIVHCDSPATTAATEAPPPLYGICVDWNLPIVLSNTPVRWLCEPGPAEAMLTCPCLALQ